MYLLLLWSGKLIQKTSRLFHNSGAALPGLFIERLYPKFLEKALNKLPEGAVVISGTNGKTTTTKIVAETLASLGQRVMTNSSGSNMTRGLISTVVSKSKIFGRLPFDIAVLEVDVAYASVLSKKVPIKSTLVLNVMRDQLDRFGEIDITARYLSNLTKAATGVVVLNADDTRVAKLPTNKSAKKVYFGIAADLKNRLKSDDEWHSQAQKSFTKADVILESSYGFNIGIGDHKRTVSQLEGVHNHLNFVAAFCLLSSLLPDNDQSELIDVMSKVKPAFGRGERVKIGDSVFDIQLIKNPSSFTQTVRAANLDNYKTVTVSINDAYADGRDVSWLWDAEVDDFRKAKILYTAGTRAEDMAVRLKYADINNNQIFTTEAEMISALKARPGVHAIFCTYTAMMSIRKELVRLGHAERIS
jgi:UDP-N-acetylmuramyl tripeptide synthase